MVQSMMSSSVAFTNYETTNLRINIFVRETDFANSFLGRLQTSFSRSEKFNFLSSQDPPKTVFQVQKGPNFGFLIFQTFYKN